MSISLSELRVENTFNSVTRYHFDGDFSLGGGVGEINLGEGAGAEEVVGDVVRVDSFGFHG